jgi:histidinol dehydrogenase
MQSPLKSPLIQRIDARSGTSSEALTALRHKLSPQGNVVSEKGKKLTERVFGRPLTPQQVVETICEDVRKQGTPALLHYSQQLDGQPQTAEQFRVDLSELEKAHTAARPELLQAVRRIASNITRFQKSILHHDVFLEPEPGIRLRQRYWPLKRIGVCVPGGAAAYPSTVLMTVVPAQAAGVEQIAIVAPPTPFGAYNPDVLATCYELGVKEVYAVGGAQAVAAMAYGTDVLPGVDKIVGPGSLFVALAKKYVYGDVDIDSIAGPSEVIVLADTTARADFIAADMLAQAEHSPGSSLLITWEPSLLDQVESQLAQQIGSLERSQLTLDSLVEFGAMILAKDEKHACELTDLLAPEHLHIATKNPESLSDNIRNAGATFLGNYSPVALGDYAAGPSHVLPTGGTARWASGLNANSFLRSGSIIEYSQQALKDITAEISLIAQCEGLTAHKRSVTMRSMN